MWHRNSIKQSNVGSRFALFDRDAALIVVTTEDIKHIELRDMTYKDLEHNILMFDKLGNETRRNAVQWSAPDAMLWLWKVAVKPILDDVQLTPSKRVWWIITGLAGRAPFHAAGDHSPGSQENTQSRVVSSYISSFKALRFAREKQNTATSSTNHRMLLVTMSSNQPPHLDLNTSHEEQVTKDLFGSSMTHLSHPSPKDVLAKLPSYSLVHFACHGASIAYNPSRSGLLLLGEDQEAAMLTISVLERVNLKAAAIAYLSARSTAEQVDGKFADEAIHLANSFQALGFQHVIGSMWGAEDAAAGEVAKRFYKGLFSNGQDGENLHRGHLDVAHALYKAMV